MGKRVPWYPLMGEEESLARFNEDIECAKRMHQKRLESIKLYFEQVSHAEINKSRELKDHIGERAKNVLRNLEIISRDDLYVTDEVIDKISNTSRTELYNAPNSAMATVAIIDAFLQAHGKRLKR